MPEDTAPTPTSAPVVDATPPAENPSAEPITTPPSTWMQEIWDTETPGAFTKGWQEKLPSEFEGDKAMLANYSDMKGLVKAFKDNMTQARAKAGLFKPLSDNPTPEELTAFRDALGIKEDAYNLEKPEQLPEYTEWRDDRVGEFKKWAYDQNLTPKQAKEAINFHMGLISGDMKAMADAQKKEHTEYLARERQSAQTEYGGAISEAVTNAQRAAIMHGFPADSVDPNSDSYAGTAVLRLLARVAELEGESRLPSAAAVQNTGFIRQAIDMMRNQENPDYKLMERRDPATEKKYYDLIRKGLAAGEKMPG